MNVAAVKAECYNFEASSVHSEMISCLLLDELKYDLVNTLENLPYL
jgi:hypothetical protein